MAVRRVVLAGAWIAAMAVCMASEPPAVAPGANDGPDPEVAAAIQALRGHSGANLSPEDSGPLGKKLDAAWKVLYDHPEAARKAVHEVLATEREDSFLIIDLAHFLTSTEDNHTSLELAASAVGRADVRVHPSGTFHALANMASGDCAACLPAVLRILELKDPSTFIAQHALTIDADLGVAFTLGQYGDAAIPGVVAALESPDCIVRTNAARALIFLLPESAPPGLRDMPVADRCPEARLEAWRALGVLDDPGLAALARRRLDTAPRPDTDERLAIADGLGSTFSPAARRVLEGMRDDPDAKVSKAAREGAKTLAAVEKEMARLRKLASGESQPPGHERTVRSLEEGAREGRFEIDEEHASDFVSHLTPDDVALVNRTRAAVLERQSDECLYEYYPLTYAVRVLRSLRSSAPTGPPPPASVH